MAKVVVRFFDDETLEGVARDLDFDEPDFLVVMPVFRDKPMTGIAVPPSVRHKMFYTGYLYRDLPLHIDIPHEIEEIGDDVATDTMVSKPIEADALLRAIDVAMGAYASRTARRARVARR